MTRANLRAFLEWARRHPVLAGILGLAIAFACVSMVLLFVVPRSPLDGGTERIIVQVISSAALVLAAVIPVQLSTRKTVEKVAADTAVVRAEVKNSHTTNLREESDDRHTSVMDVLLELQRDQREMREEMRETRSDVRGLRRDGGRQDDRLMRLEQAIFPTPTDPHQETP
ncbi:hypothetical protein [uncultured Microbacterium sp.]|uniref:hypothetical protein n=1 Tax=uncultured Microbacterium sp. TaxID=191216 RepID=UPI0025F16B31|nr:hypothetical protein [uncultured Microbacterium sp.]